MLVFNEENVIVACPNPAKLVHDESGLPSSTSHLNALPNFVINWRASVEKIKEKHIAWR